MHNAALGTACTGADPTPIITGKHAHQLEKEEPHRPMRHRPQTLSGPSVRSGVLSGEAAHMASTVGSEDPLWTRTTPPPSPQTTRLPPPTSGSSRPVASSDKLQLKGQLHQNMNIHPLLFRLLLKLRQQVLQFDPTQWPFCMFSPCLGGLGLSRYHNNK